MHKIILASASPARKKLMRDLGVPFKTVPSDYQEDMNARKTPQALAKFLALNKALFIAPSHPNSIIIGADTFGTIDGKKIGKPANHKEAQEIIRKMSNHKMEVHTGVAVIKTDSTAQVTKKLTSHTVTKISFTKITEDDITHIIKTDEVLTTAGAFTIEGAGGKFVKEINGDYHNVIGLPLFKLKEMLNLLRK